MTSTRTDIHRPSLLDPAEYSFLGCFYQGDSDDIAKEYARDETELQRNIERAEATPFHGNYEAKFTCDHCGARFAHGVVFLHTPTNEYISVGHICASDTIGLPTKAAALRKRAEKAARAAAERRATIEAGQVWRNEHVALVSFLTGTDHKHPFLRDMVVALERYGSLTEGQTNASLKFQARAAEFAARDAQRAAEAPVTATFPEGRQTVTGEVVTTKTQDSFYGPQRKMLVKLTDGNKVWGTIPASLDENYDEETGAHIDPRGATITFTATFEVSKDDEHFGFFKRPTKVSVAGEAA